MKITGLVLIGLILAGATVLQVLPRSAPEVEARSKLGLLPASLPGWQVSDVSLGATEAAEANVAGVLQFDDVVFREYRSPKATFAVYAAYWRPGKMPTQLVASHTPDRCWTSAGWRCEEMRFAEEISIRSVVGDQLPVVGEEQPVIDRSLITDHRSPQLKPAQWRRFTAPNGGTQYVLFWQLVGDELYDLGERFSRMPHPVKWWRDVAKQIFRDPPEQYFIRLSSDRPFEELAGDAGFQAVMNALAGLGLGEKAERLKR